jgi:hypothetical protein
MGEEYDAFGNGHNTFSKEEFVVPLASVPCFRVHFSKIPAAI